MSNARNRLPDALLRWVPALLLLVTWAGIFMWAGIPLSDIARFCGYLAWGVLLPGVLVYRALRATHHSLVDDLVAGGIVGLVLEIGAYCLYASLGLQQWLLSWPILVVIPFLAFRRLRRHWWVTGGQRPPIAWAWTLAAVVVFYSLYIVGEMRLAPPVVAPTGTWYIFDMQGLLALAAEAKHHFPPQAPMVLGEQLSYHWFCSAHQASASLISGVELSLVFHGFEPIVMGGGAIMALALLGWRVSGRAWVGATAAALTFVIGELTIGSSSPWLGSTTTFVWASPTTVYSWCTLYLLAMVIIDRIRDGGLPGAVIGRGAWVLIAVLSMAAAGSKSTGLPTVLCGVLLAGLARVVATRKIRGLVPYAAVAALIMLAFGVALTTLYRGSSSGLTIDPLAAVALATKDAATASLLGKCWIYLVALGGYAIYELPRLAGVPVLVWLVSRGRASWSSAEWFLLGGIAGGLAGTLLGGHPSGSYLYFIRSAWGFGAVLSAIGFVRLAEHHRISARVLTAVMITCAVAVVVPYSIVYQHMADAQLVGLQRMRPMYVAAILVVSALLLGAVIWRPIRSLRPSTRGIGATAALVLVLGAGLPNLPVDAHEVSQWSAVRAYHEKVTPEMVRAGRWIRDHSDPDEVVATNQHSASVPKGFALSFWVNDYAERRTLVGSWVYFTRSIELARKKNTHYLLMPFWDPALLERNDAAFSAPTSDAIAWLRGTYNVRWMVVDRDITGPESPDLRSFADLEFQEGPIAVYHLR